MIDWIGWDRILFATDYPHWDYDDPAQALPFKMTEAQRRGFTPTDPAWYNLGQGQPEGPAVGRVELPAQVAAVLQPVKHTGQRA